MKQIRYTLLVLLAALFLLPSGAGATDAEVLQKDLKMQDVFGLHMSNINLRIIR